jgi:hypothetical protein
VIDIPEAIYFAGDDAPSSSPIRHRDAPQALAVLDAHRGGAIVGSAALVGRDGADTALYRLTVRGVELPGLMIVAGRRFRPAQ